MIATYCPIFQKHANKLVKGLEKHVNGPEFDIMSHLNYSAFESSMGISILEKIQN